MSAAYCRLAPEHPVHGSYHDTEYGFPAKEEHVLFERLVLEINQAGLSSLTILNKRPSFRAAYAGFDVDRVAQFGPQDMDRLLSDPGIIRNRLKIEAAVDNARRIQTLRRSTDRSRIGSMGTTRNQLRRGHSSSVVPFVSPADRSSTSF